MQHSKTGLLYQLLGLKQDLPPVGVDCFVGLNPAKARVLVAQVAKTSHQQPLVSRVAPLKTLTLRIAGWQLSDHIFVAAALLQQGGECLGNQTHAVPADRSSELRYRLTLAALGPHRLGRDVVVHHDAGIHGGEVQFGHTLIQPRNRGIHQTAFVGRKQIQAGFERLRLAFLPGNQDSAALRGGHLHGTDPGSC